jgi:hypothetical protein
MARAASYRDLQAEGLKLRQRVARHGLTGPAVEALVRDVRVWQLRCAVAVAVRSPGLVAEFRSRAGALQERASHGWTAAPDWQPALSVLISSWIGAIDWAEAAGAEG